MAFYSFLATSQWGTSSFSLQHHLSCLLGSLRIIRVLRSVRTHMSDPHSKRRSPILLERWLGPNMFSIPSSRSLSEDPRPSRLVLSFGMLLYVQIVYVCSTSYCRLCLDMLDLHSRSEPTIFIERWSGPVLCFVLSSRPLREDPQLI